MARCYKELSTCRGCRKRYVLDKNSEYYSRFYCPACFKKYLEASGEAKEDNSGLS